MNNIINKLYYGEIIPCEKPAPNTEKYIKTRETICSTEEQLLEQFPTCKKLLDTNAGCIESVKPKARTMRAYNADTEIPMLYTLRRSYNVWLILREGSDSALN